MPGTIALVVRHAEKATGTSDPPLTEAGRARAGALAEIAADLGVRAIYSTSFRRTLETAGPTSDRLGVPIDTRFGPADSAGLAAYVRESHGGETVLIVGHSNTVPAIVEALGGGEMAPIPETEYGTLYVVHPRADGRADVRIRRF